MQARPNENRPISRVRFSPPSKTTAYEFKSAGGENRTRTGLPLLDFESDKTIQKTFTDNRPQLTASTNSVSYAMLLMTNMLEVFVENCNYFFECVP